MDAFSGRIAGKTVQISVDGLTDECHESTVDVGVIVGDEEIHILSFEHDGETHDADWYADRLETAVDWVLERGGHPTFILSDNTSVMPASVKVLQVSLCARA